MERGEFCMKNSNRRSGRKSVLLALGWYVQEIVLGVVRYARQAGWQVNDIMSHNGMVPSGWKGDGIIALIDSWQDKKWIDFVLHAGVPVVDLSDQLPDLPVARVLPDNLEIGRIAAEHFLERGFSHLAFLSLGDAPVVAGRLEGFRRATLAGGKQFTLLNYIPQWARPGARERFLPWLGKELAKLPKPVGVMAHYDGEANDILRACVEAGLRVPEEVAVVGVDNDPIYCDLGPVPLSSVDSNREQLGYRGAELLDHLMRGGRLPAAPIRIAPGGVVVRHSSDIIAVSDPVVARAMEFMVRHFAEPITVDRIAGAAGVSRRALYTRFEQQVGRPILKELTRLRLDRAKELLRNTDDKLQAIAIQVGLSEVTHLSKFFTMRAGLSPSQYRAQFRQEG